MNASLKAAAIAAILALTVCFAAVSADAAEEQEYDTDLGQKWSYEIQFVFTGGSATKITWDFGDGSEPISDDASDGQSDYTVWNPSHVYAEKGVYYVTQTVEGSSGNTDTAVFKIEIMGYPYVTLVYDNGQSNGTIQMESGGSSSVAATQPEDPTKTGYTFTGWYTTPECEELYDWSTVVKKPVTVYAGWSENAKANIAFDVGEGYPPVETVQWTIGTEYTIPGYDGTRDGYTFGGWSYDGQTYLEGQKITVTGDMTLTAVWNELDRYTVSFDLAGGTGTFPAQTVYVNETASEPDTEPTKTGHTFAGWYLCDAPYVFTTPVTGNITLTAHWTPIEYTVTFDSDGGSDVPEQKVPYGSKATEPDDPTKSSYTFEGWLLNGTPYDFDTPVTGNITLVADWSYVQPPVTRYTVTFDPDNGEDTFTSTVVAGNAVSEPKQPERDGYTFDGWYLGDKEYVFTTPVNGDITLKAHWTPVATYTVSFDSGVGPSAPARTVTAGSAVVLPTINQSGHVFKGWQNGDELLQPGQSFTPTSDVKLTAVWEVIDQKHTVTFDDGENQKEITVKHNGRVSPVKDPVRDGYEFKGWLLDGEPYDFSARITADMTLTAQWEQLPPRITVDKDIPDDVVMTEPIPDDVAEGDEIRLPEASRPGQSFQGWDTDGDGAVDTDANETIVYEDGMTLEPVFGDIDPDTQHKVTIEDAPEIPFEDWYVEEDKPIVLPDIPREDETLVGYEDQDGNMYEPGEEFAPTGDVTLRPVFEPKEPVKVNVTIGDGAVLSEAFPGKLYVGSFVTLPDASRQGYELEGWDVSFGDVSLMSLYWPGDVVEVMGDMTVTAVWTPLVDEVQNEIVMDSPDGDMPYDSWFEVDGNPVTLPQVSDGDRYVVGYEDEDGNTYEPGTQFYPSGDTTLKVVWSDSRESEDDGSGIDWWIYAVVVIVIIALIALVLILHFRVGVI